MIEVWRTVIASTLGAASLAARTTSRPATAGADSVVIAARHHDRSLVHQGHIAHAVSSFVSGRNSGDSAVLKEVLAKTAYLTMSTPRQAVRAPDTGTSVTRIGSHRILAFAPRDRAAGQRLSFERVRVVGTRGADGGLGVRARYPDGSGQRYIGPKFAYSCDEGALVRVVLVANARAR